MEPENYPDKKDALVKDFRTYLGILKAVHSGADLNASAEAVGGSLPGSAKGFVGYVLSHQGDHVILPLIENAVAARAEIAPALAGNRWVVDLGSPPLTSRFRGALHGLAAAVGCSQNLGPCHPASLRTKWRPGRMSHLPWPGTGGWPFLHDTIHDLCGGSPLRHGQ